jgi:urocanate hydratase
MTIGTRIIRAPRGSALSCEGWPQEAALRRLDHDGTLLIQEDRGLTIYEQMTAESWTYIGTQGILQGTDETFATMNGGAALVVDVDRDRIARSMALEASAAEALAAILQRDAIPDAVTDQTSAHDARNRYVPHGMSLAEAAVLRERHPQQCIERSMASMARHVAALPVFRARGAVTCDDGNHIRAQAQHAGVENAFDIPGFVPEDVRPLVCAGNGSFRWAALSGDPDDIRVTDDAVLEMFPDDEPLDARAGASGTIVTGGAQPAREAGERE